MAARQRQNKTSHALMRQVQQYLDSISRTVEVTEQVPTGEVDEKGRPLYERKPIYNDRGEIIRTREYLIPPTITGICLHLGITPGTWKRWCDHQAHPELEEATEWVTGILQAWSEEQLLTRKDVRGVVFHLQNNHGYAQKVEVEAGPQTRTAQALTTQEKLALLQELWEGGGQVKLPDGNG
ncbi:terminase small subunit [Pseudoflavonifractor sp. An85]|uniref:terminase small subunit n=1 Tax=Pseudoflavonifractor sp. An85 TaxID=1965661 RepID=UPI000B382D34|nr:terminase small subunit [Pseudoflavonifractor sp. An85]OUN21603.1 hypothetical protein B5G37_10910 [Pseudoflavonifractor sp. An85]